MKKLVALFVFISLLLLIGSQSLSAGTTHPTNCSSYHVDNKHHIKFTDKQTGNPLIEEASLDVEDTASDAKDAVPNKIFKSNYTLDNWYLSLCGQLLLNQYQKNFKIFAPFCGQSNPIYITHRVLRI